MSDSAAARLCVRWLDEGGERGPPLLSDDDNCGVGTVYDPETDPHETVNVAKVNPEITQAHLKQLRAQLNLLGLRQLKMKSFLAN